MHFYGIMRGIKENADKVKKQLECQWYPLERIDVETGKKHMIAVQGMLRPIELFEYVIPENCMAGFVKSIGLIGDAKEGYWGEKNGAKAKMMLPFLRKLLGAKKMPDYKDDPGQVLYPLKREGVGIEPIGIKEDGYTEFKYSDDARLGAGFPWYREMGDKKFRQEAI